MDMKSAHTLDELNTILRYIIETEPESRADFDIARRRICSDMGTNQPANRFLLQAYQTLVEEGKLEEDKKIEGFMRKANIRNLSGIAVVTSLVKPYMCPGKCVYCPTEVRMPKSYIASEPAAARALRLNFSPYQQVKKRIEMLQLNGHSCDKIEYIIKGGTWNSYPIKYQYWFMYESFKAANDLSREQPIGETSEEDWKNKTLEDLQKAIDKEQTINEKADHRLIGVTLETRPDAIHPKTIDHMRRQGCTRIELGLQATDDKILELIKRGHTVAQFRTAMHMLRQAGFKVDLHFMPDLPGTSAEHDVEMYKEIFSDKGLRPDMIKIYPCTVIKSAELYKWLQDGTYKPYGDAGLFEALMKMQLSTPRYCRISRLIRDIPSDVIEAGNKITNLREALSRELTNRGETCVCLRCREIGRQEKNIPADTEPELFIDEYETIGGREYFISLEDPKRIAVYGFIRLRLPHPVIPSEAEGSLGSSTSATNEKLLELMPEIKDCAFIRELHVYGTLVKIGEQSQLDTQHKGLGKKLVAKAEEIAKEHDWKKVAVISGVGVRGYYEKIGYKKEGTYMIKHLTK